MSPLINFVLQLKLERTFILILSFVCSIIAYFTTDLPATSRKAYKILGPMIEERLRHVEEADGEWSDKPVCC